MTRILRAAFYAALFVFGNSLSAQDVTLISTDNSVEISGTLLGFDGEFYRVDTVYGELTVDGSGVRCDGPACPNLQDFVAEITFSGSATIGNGIMPALLEGFAAREGWDLRREPDFFEFRDGQNKAVARFFVHATATESGFVDYLEGNADIVMALREVGTDEVGRARDAGLGDISAARRGRVVALDAIVPVVASGNPVHSISPLALAKALSGEITNWVDLGGPDAPITVHIPGQSSGLGQAVADQILAPVGGVIAEGVVTHAMPSTIVDAVKRDPFALGIASYSGIEKTVPLSLRDDCGFSVRATRQTIKTEDYPLTAPMFLYLPHHRLPKSGRDFVTFLRSPNAQSIIRNAGFVDQSPEEVPVRAQGQRLSNAILAAGPEVALEELQRMMDTLKDYSRLSISFRFETGSTRPDAQSRSNIVQIAQAIEAGDFDGRSLLLVGFSDGDGAAETNKRIAFRRAQAIEKEIESIAETANYDRVTLQTEAFGEAMPMACDDSAWGRKINRRVEVWVR